MTTLEKLQALSDEGHAVSLSTRRSGWGCDVDHDSEYYIRAYGLNDQALAVDIAYAIVYGEPFDLPNGVPPPIVDGKVYRP